MEEQIGCSAMTLRRLLQRQGYYTSYNHNASYYTIQGIPQFDQDGLWEYRGVLFSQWGSLTDTIVHFVQQSPSGLSARELEQRLKLENVKPNLTVLVQKETLTRQKVEERFVYFAPKAAVAKQQQQQRSRDIALSAPKLPSLEHIIALLVEIIKHPKSTPRQWAQQLARQGISLGSKEISGVLQYYGLDVKKGL
jgi:hypothetical protein